MFCSSMVLLLRGERSDWKSVAGRWFYVSFVHVTSDRKTTTATKQAGNNSKRRERETAGRDFVPVVKYTHTHTRARGRWNVSIGTGYLARAARMDDYTDQIDTAAFRLIYIRTCWTLL